jgi:hypothetical protein
MAAIDPHWLEYRRKYFIRPNGNVKPRANAHLSIRHDAWRFMPPGSLASLRERNLAIITRGESADGLSVGSFSSLQSANKLVNSTLSQNPGMVDQVATGRLSATTVTARFGSATGYEAYGRTERSQPYLRDTYGVGVVIRHDPTADKGYHVVTAFPKF